MSPSLSWPTRRQLGCVQTFDDLSLAELEAALDALTPRLASIIAGDWPALRQRHRDFLAQPALRQGFTDNVEILATQDRVQRISEYCLDWVLNSVRRLVWLHRR